MLALMATALALAGAEVVIRVFHVGPEIAAVYRENYRLSQNTALQYELVPGSVDGEGVINRHGMRDRDYLIEKPDNTFRIAMIGDSICFGYRVAQDEAASAHLERLLAMTVAESGPRYEVLNFGVTGYNFAQIMENLHARVARFSPDLVIYLYCINDPQDYSTEMTKLLATLTEAQKDHVRLATRRDASWLHRSRLYMVGRYFLQSRTKAGGRVSKRRIRMRDDPQFAALDHGTYVEYYRGLHADPESWGPVNRGLKSLAAWSQESGVPVHICLYPVLKELDPYPLAELHTELAERFDACGFSNLDVTEHFVAYEAESGERLGRRSLLHPTKEGHRVAAVALLCNLLDQGFLEGLDASGLAEALSASDLYADAYRLVQKQMASAEP